MLRQIIRRSAALHQQQKTLLSRTAEGGVKHGSPAAAHQTGAPDLGNEPSQNPHTQDRIDSWWQSQNWTREELEAVAPTHTPPRTVGDYVAYFLVRAADNTFSVLSGMKRIFPWQSSVPRDVNWMNKSIMLETVAVTPAFSAAIIRYWRSLGGLKQDKGWIHTLLDDAENERMHLSHWLFVKRPGFAFRMTVLGAQTMYVTLFTLKYMLMPRISHRMVGYLEEAAVEHYTKMLNEMNREGSPIAHWKSIQAPKASVEYWRLEPNANLYDVILSIRKDEANQVDCNHEVADKYRKVKNHSFPTME